MLVWCLKLNTFVCFSKTDHLNHIMQKFEQNWCWCTGSLFLSFLSFMHYSMDPSGGQRLLLWRWWWWWWWWWLMPAALSPAECCASLCARASVCICSVNTKLHASSQSSVQLIPLSALANTYSYTRARAADKAVLVHLSPSHSVPAVPDSTRCSSWRISSVS